MGCFKWQGKGSDSFVGGKIGRMRGAEFLRIRPYFREGLFFLEEREFNYLFILKILWERKIISRIIFDI